MQAPEKKTKSQKPQAESPWVQNLKRVMLCLPLHSLLSSYGVAAEAWSCQSCNSVEAPQNVRCFGAGVVSPHGVSI